MAFLCARGAIYLIDSFSCAVPVQMWTSRYQVTRMTVKSLLEFKEKQSCFRSQRSFWLQMFDVFPIAVYLCIFRNR